MTPRHLRGRAGIELGAVASALGMSVDSLRILESTPLGSWSVQQLARYAAACGRVLKIVAVRDDGRGDELS